MIPEQATRLAIECFKENHLLSFVGGSYATSQNGPNSDVDLLVIIRRSDLATERIFADRFCELHKRNSLKLTHCGEIFTRSTVDHLLRTTEIIADAFPGILETACYHADCILSFFRKGDIVMKFFADPKICVTGDRKLLAAYEAVAREYFARTPMPRIQTEIGNISYSEANEEDRCAHKLRQLYEGKIRAHLLLDTPVGIGLERWFGDWLSIRPPCKALPRTETEDSVSRRKLCPRNSFPLGSVVDSLIKRQCLGSYCEELNHDKRSVSC